MGKNVLISFVLLAVCGLSACGGGGQLQEKECYTGMSGECAGEKVSVYVDDQKLLHIYNRESGQSGILCGKPDCEHKPYDERTNPDPVCMAALNGELNAACIPAICDGYLYLFGNKNLSQGVVYREKLDGSGRTEVKVMDYQIGMGSSLYVRDGFIYAEANIPLVNKDHIGGSGTNQSDRLMIRICPATGEVEEISPVLHQDRSSVLLLDYEGDDIYYWLSWKEKSGEYVQLYCYNTKTGTYSMPVDEGKLTGMTLLGVDKGMLYASDGKKAVYRISFGGKEWERIYSSRKSGPVFFVMYQDQLLEADMDNGKFHYTGETGAIDLTPVAAIVNTFGKYMCLSERDGTSKVYYDSQLRMSRKERGNEDEKEYQTFHVGNTARHSLYGVCGIRGGTDRTVGGKPAANGGGFCFTRSQPETEGQPYADPTDG